MGSSRKSGEESDELSQLNDGLIDELESLSPDETSSARFSIKNIRTLREAAYAKGLTFSEVALAELASTKATRSRTPFREIQKSEVLNLAESKLRKRRFYQPSAKSDGEKYNESDFLQMLASPNGAESSAKVVAGNELTEASGKQRTVAKDTGMVSHLLDLGYSPERITALSDVLDQPAVLDSVEPSLLTWLELQRARGYWFNGMSLILLSLTTAVGRGYLESFWSLMVTWSGLVFLIPYFLVYFFICIPLLNFEFVTGQLTRSSPPNMMSILSFRARGLGIAMVIVSAMTGCIVQSRYASEFFVYLTYSFQIPQPWKLTEAEKAACEAIGSNRALCTDVTAACIFSVQDGVCVGSDTGKANFFFQKSFYPYVFQNDKEDLTALDWRMVLGTFATWILVIGFLAAGLSSFSFASAAILTLIGIIYIAQVVIGFQLDGAADGASHLLRSWEWDYLWKSSSLWTQCTASALSEIAVGIGIYSTLAAHSRIGSNVVWGSYIVAAGDNISTLLTYVGAVGIVGYLAKKTRNSLTDMISMTVQNYSFVLYPVGFQFSGPIEPILYMLYYGGSGILICATISVNLQVILDSIIDTKWFYRTKRQNFTIPVSIVLFLLSFSVATRNGRLVVNFMEFYFGDVARAFFVLFISILLGWCYGFRKQASEVGIETVLLFDFICWIGIIGGSFISINMSSVPFLYWYPVRILVFLIAFPLALVLGPKLNGNGPKWLHRQFPDVGKKLPAMSCKERMWSLFLGNIEHFQKEVQRVVCGNTSSFGRLTSLWSFCIKWVISNVVATSLVDFANALSKRSAESQLFLAELPLAWIIFVGASGLVLSTLILSFIMFPECTPERNLLPPGCKQSLSLLPSRVSLTQKASSGRRFFTFDEFFVETKYFEAD